MTEGKKDGAEPDTAAPDEEKDGAHTELRRPGKEDKDEGGSVRPKPRAKVLPEDVRDDPDEDDPFNDVPV